MNAFSVLLGEWQAVRAKSHRPGRGLLIFLTCSGVLEGWWSKADARIL